MTTPTSTRRPRDLIVAASAVLATAAIAVGIPALLLGLVGNPLPEQLPSAADLEAALARGEIADATVFKAIACIGWVLWAQLVLTITLEVSAGIQGRTARRLPLGVPSRFVATRLAAAILLVTGILGSRSTTAHAAELRHAPPPAIAFPNPAPPPLSEPPAPPVPPPAQTPPYVVERGDTLWSIAEATLGDPLRWPELETLNIDRSQPDGNALTPGGRLQPGWQLALPADAALTPTEAAPQPGVVAVEPGDTLWDLAAEQLGDPLRWPELYEHNKGPQPEGGVLSDPDLILPGWQLDLPPTGTATPPTAGPPPPPAQAPVPTMPESPPSPPSTTVPTPTSTPSTGPVPESAPPNQETSATADESGNPDGEHGEDRLPLGVGGGALLALGIVATLRVLRHRQLKRRLPGHAPAAPSPDLAATEIAVRTAADDAPGPWLDAALRTLSREHRGHPIDRVAQPVAVEIAASEVRVTLAEPHPHPPPPWATSPPGWVWRLARSTPLDQLERAAVDACAPLPTLITIGRSSDGPVLLNLEACGLVSVTGPPEETRALARSAALELAVTPIADALEVLTVGSDLITDGAATPRVRTVDSVENAVHVAGEATLATTRALDSHGFPNTFAARGASAGSDPWAPTALILDSAPPDDQTRNRLVSLTDPPGRGLGVLVIGEWPDAPWTIHVADGRLDVPRLGISGLETNIDAQVITPEAAQAVVDLLDQTLQHSSDPLVEEPEPPEHSALRPNDEPTEIEVRVLGDVEIVGAARALNELETDLVAFLATRDEPVEADTVQTALWPQRAVSAKRWWNVVAETRKALGASASGEFHFPPVPKGQRVTLGPTVGTDLNRIRNQLRAAEHQATGDAITILADALTAVRGRPFTGGRGYAWANADGRVAYAEAVVTDAAHLLANLCMDTGDHAAALDATAAGLRAAPANEVLYRDRMRAHHQAGNTSGIDADMRDLCAALDIEDPCDELHPDTVAVYEELTRHQPARIRARSG